MSRQPGGSTLGEIRETALGRARWRQLGHQLRQTQALDPTVPWRRMARPDFDVREAVNADIPRIEECYLRSWRAAYDGFMDADVLAVEAEKRRSFDWRRGITASTSVVLIAVDPTGEVVGVVQADEDLPPPRNLPEVTMLYVNPDAWGSPVAVALLRAAEGWMVSQGHESARLRVVEEHHRARRFYEREGWSMDPDIESARNDFARLVYYRRSLNE